MPLPTFISAEEVEKWLDLHQLLQLLEKAFGLFSKGPQGGVVQPVRHMINVEKYKGFLGVMPAYSAVDDALATKLVAVYPHNTDAPTHQAQVYLFDPRNGNLLAILDGDSITAIRTGVASAVATKHLANPKSKVLALVGAGVQAGSHYKALAILYNFEEVRIWSRKFNRADELAKKIGDHAKACHTVEETVKGADIICTVSFSQTPLINKEWVKEGAHINSVGAPRPDWQELYPDLVQSSVVYADSREACLKEAGDIVLSNADIYAELGEVINGEKEAHWQKTTIFKSVGMALEDVVAAKLVYDKYTAGQEKSTA